MERSYSTKSGRDQRALTLPPWEQRHMVQVPYMDASSPTLSNAEREALPHLWATRSQSTSRHTPTSSLSRQTPPRIASPPLPAPPHHAAYERDYHVPPAPYTAPLPAQKPTVTRVVAPPTPPDSLSNSSSFSETSPPINRSVSAFPGTMSSRSRTASRSRTRPSTRGRSAPKLEKAHSVPFGTRFKTAVKDMFTRNPVDESQFVPIKDRHWTEEDY